MRVWVCVNVLAVLLYAAGGDTAATVPVSSSLTCTLSQKTD